MPDRKRESVVLVDDVLKFETILVVDLYSLEAFDCEAIQSHFGIWGSGTGHRLTRPTRGLDDGFPEDVHCAISWLFKHIPSEHNTIIVMIS